MRIKFRPHHFLCTLGFEGKGYSLGFVKNYLNIVKKLKGPGGDALSITVVESVSDDVCQACPLNEATQCASETKVQTLDKAHQEILQLETGQTLTWGEAKQRLTELMTLDKFHKACGPCGWKKYGVCEKHLAALQKNA